MATERSKTTVHCVVVVLIVLANVLDNNAALVGRRHRREGDKTGGGLGKAGSSTSNKIVPTPTSLATKTTLKSPSGPSSKTPIAGGSGKAGTSTGNRIGPTPTSLSTKTTQRSPGGRSSKTPINEQRNNAKNEIGESGKAVIGTGKPIAPTPSSLTTKITPKSPWVPNSKTPTAGVLEKTGTGKTKGPTPSSLTTKATPKSPGGRSSKTPTKNSDKDTWDKGHQGEGLAKRPTDKSPTPSMRSSLASKTTPKSPVGSSLKTPIKGGLGNTDTGKTKRPTPPSLTTKTTPKSPGGRSSKTPIIDSDKDTLEKEHQGGGLGKGLTDKRKEPTPSSLIDRITPKSPVGSSSKTTIKAGGSGDRSSVATPKVLPTRKTDTGKKPETEPDKDIGISKPREDKKVDEKGGPSKGTEEDMRNRKPTEDKGKKPETEPDKDIGISKPGEDKKVDEKGGPSKGTEEDMRNRKPTEDKGERPETETDKDSGIRKPEKKVDEKGPPSEGTEVDMRDKTPTEDKEQSRDDGDVGDADDADDERHYINNDFGDNRYEYEDKDIEKAPKPRPGATGIKKTVGKDHMDSPSSGHFMAYFITVCVFCVLGYLAFHNKQKIMAFIIEGKSVRRRRSPSGGAQYKRLETNVEEALSHIDKSASTQNYIY